MANQPTDRRDPRDVPNYSLGEAARWLGIRSTTLRALLQGERRRASDGTRRDRSVLHPASSHPLTLSFWNLVECSVLSLMLARLDVPLQNVRRALARVARDVGAARPLIDRRFGTDGVELLVAHCGRWSGATRPGETATIEVAGAGLRRIECDEAGLATRLFPWRVDPREPLSIAIDPNVAFGRPVLAATRVPVEVICDRYRAGDSMVHLAADHRVTRDVIEDLVRKWFRPAAA